MADRDLLVYQSGNWVSPTIIGSYSNATSSFSNVGNVSVYYSGDWVEVWPPYNFTPPNLTAIKPDTVFVATNSSGVDRIYFANIESNVWNDSGINNFGSGDSVRLTSFAQPGGSVPAVALFCGNTVGSNNGRFIVVDQLNTTVANSTVSQPPRLVYDVSFGPDKFNVASWFNHTTPISANTTFQAGMCLFGDNGAAYYFANVYHATSTTAGYNSSLFYQTINIGNNSVKGGYTGVDNGDNFLTPGSSTQLLTTATDIILDSTITNYNAVLQYYYYPTPGYLYEATKNADGSALQVYDNTNVQNTVFNFWSVKLGYNINHVSKPSLGFNTLSTTHTYFQPLTPVNLRELIDFRVTAIAVGNNGVILYQYIGYLQTIGFFSDHVTDGTALRLGGYFNGWMQYNGWGTGSGTGFTYSNPWTETDNLNWVGEVNGGAYSVHLILGDNGKVYYLANTSGVTGPVWFQETGIATLTSESLRWATVAVYPNGTKRLVIVGDNDTLIVSDKFSSGPSTYTKITNPGGVDAYVWKIVENYGSMRTN